VLDVSYAVTPSRANDQLGLVSLTVTPITWRNADDGLTVTDSLDTRAASNATFEKSTDASARQIALTTTLDGTGQRATYVSQLEGTGTLTQTGLDGNDTIEQSLRTAVEQGKSYTFTKFVGLATNQDTGNTTAETRAAAAAVARKAASLGRNAVQSSSDAAWAEL
jgi:trehalose/maltose hydrolase-like predicted phosphorylase